MDKILPPLIHPVLSTVAKCGGLSQSILPDKLVHNQQKTSCTAAGWTGFLAANDINDQKEIQLPTTVTRAVSIPQSSVKYNSLNVQNK